jgi:anti-sigma factor RsiW
MNCDEVRRHWDLYHDSEGDAELHWQISEHLGDCAECAEWYAKQSRLEDLVSERLARVQVDEQLWQAVLAGSGIMPAVRQRRWMLFSAVFACAATLLLALGWFWNSASDSSNLTALATTWHQGLLDGDNSPSFTSRSDREVEEHLRHEVSFRVRCPPRADSGFNVEGAETLTLAGEQAAVVVGRVDQEPVSVFVLSRDSLAAFPRQAKSMPRDGIQQLHERGFEMAYSVIDRNLVLVVGRAPPARLLRVLKAYGTYPHEET